jgi:hypothetical protein
MVTIVMSHPLLILRASPLDDACISRGVHQICGLILTSSLSRDALSMQTRMHVTYASTVVPVDYMECNFSVISPPTPRQFLFFLFLFTQEYTLLAALSCHQLWLVWTFGLWWPSCSFAVRTLGH